MSLQRWIGTGFLCASIASFLVACATSMLRATTFAETGADTCLSRVNDAVQGYVAQNGGRLPDSGSWMDQLSRNAATRETLTPSFLRPWYDAPVGFAFFDPLSGVELSRIENSDEVPLVFLSSKSEWNATGGIEDLALPTSGREYFLVLFCDGSVRRMPPEWRLETITLEVRE